MSMSMSISELPKLQQAHDKLQSGDLSGAARLCEEVLQRAPGNADALWLLGTVHVMSGEPRRAVPLLERATTAAPHHGAALEMLGLASLMLGEYARAEQVLLRALALPGAPPSVRMRYGIALLHQGRHQEAIEQLERVAALEPGDPDVHVNLGLAHAGAGNWSAAADAFKWVLAGAPEHIDALYNLGVASLELGDRELARSLFERIVALAPSFVEARERLAALHLSLGRYRQAIGELRAVVRVQPENVPALTALGNACFEAGELDEARAAAARALELDRSRASPYGLLARIHYVRGEYERAASLLEEGYECNRSCALLGTLVHLLRRLCDWPRWHATWQRLAPELERPADCGTPFYLLCEDTTAEQQLSYSRRWADARFGATTATPPRPYGGGKRARRRLRIGYFSPDFHEHATAYLLAEVLELHDRSRFEIFAYSYGPEDQSAMRARLRLGVEHFVDIAWDPDDIVLARLRADALDVLVELKGHTMGERLRVLAQRPSAVQVTWLGYPGTTGASFIDYLIADPFVIPPDAEGAYSERVLRLPHCYQPNDRKRPRLAARSRPAYGLPNEAFVFCCFNQAVKFTPAVWARWVNLLRAVPRSVLWLLEDNRWASERLRASLVEAGIEPARLVFAPRLPMPEHLARYGAADLALDTFPYTSHTTASDALWMGCPLVALCGNTFAARVSGSLLSSAGMADLIAYSLDEYAALACRLATDAALMQGVRARLAAAREGAPLFDAEKFTRDLEALYLQVAG